jgi:hypothetical protein
MLRNLGTPLPKPAGAPRWDSFRGVAPCLPAERGTAGHPLRLAAACAAGSPGAIAVRSGSSNTRWRGEARGLWMGWGDVSYELEEWGRVVWEVVVWGDVSCELEEWESGIYGWPKSDP